MKTGRKVQKEDREPLEETYANYKTTKSKLKLLDALMAKHGGKSILWPGVLPRSKGGLVITSEEDCHVTQKRRFGDCLKT